MGPTPDNMNSVIRNTELSSLEGTRCQFNSSRAVIKLGIDVHQAYYVVVKQEGGTNPKPAQRFRKEAFLLWVAKLKSQGSEVHAVYEACGFGFGLQRQLSALGITCQVVCPQKLDERNKRVKTDGLDAKALCLKLDRFLQGNRDALALVRIPTEEEEQKRAIHRQREQLVKARKRWCGCPPKKRNKSAPSTGNASNWSKCAKYWRPRVAVSWSITGLSRRPAGGSHALLLCSKCQSG